MVFLQLFLLYFLTSPTENLQSSCKKKACFSVIKATKQIWIAGTKNGGTGTNYLITCIASETSEKLKIDQLWVGDYYFEVKAVKTLEAYPKEKYLAGDTIYIQASRFIKGRGSDENEEPREQETALTPPPFKYKGEALLGYRCGKKKKYLTIASFQELERLNMP